MMLGRQAADRSLELLREELQSAQSEAEAASCRAKQQKALFEEQILQAEADAKQDVVKQKARAATLESRFSDAEGRWQEERSNFVIQVWSKSMSP